MEIPQFGEQVEVDGFTFRWAQPSDAEAFAKWSTENGKIPHKDILASMSVNNPTCAFFVIEKDGIPILFAPFYAQLALAYLGFNPEAGRKDRIEALEHMQTVSSKFARLHGINEVVVQTARDYPVGRWALKNGFEEESRQTFKLRVSPLIDPDKEAELVQ